MTSKEVLIELFNEANRFSREEPKYTTHDLWEMAKQIEKDLELLDYFLDSFKLSILQATDVLNRRGDYILADVLRDELGLIALNKLKDRLEND